MPSRAFQEVSPFVRERVFTVQRLVDAAVDLRQLILGKEGAGQEEAGADGEIPLGRLVAVGKSVRAIVVTLPQRSFVMNPFPGDELRAIAGLMPRQDGAVELCQELIAILQPIRFQRRSLFQQSHVLPCRPGRFSDAVKDCLFSSDLFREVSEISKLVDPA